MSPKHAPSRRARLVWHDTALKQVTAMTVEERARLDRLLDTIATNPAVGDPDPSGLLRDYRAHGCRALYISTVMGSVVVVAYVEA